MEEKQEMLKIENLTIEFDTETGTKQVINDLSLVTVSYTHLDVYKRQV